MPYKKGVKNFQSLLQGFRFDRNGSTLGGMKVTSERDQATTRRTPNTVVAAQSPI